MTTLVAPPVTALARPPNQQAQKITGRDYISYSQLSLMRSCPRKFAFQYVEKAQPDFKPSSLVFGGAIHTTLEQYYRGLLEGRTLGDSDLFAVYRTAWHDQESTIPIRFNKDEDEAKVHDVAQRVIAAFLASSLASPRGTILGIEESLRIVIHSDLPDLVAKVDLVVQTGGSLFVADFKTSRSRWSEERALEGSDQLVLYGLTVGSMSEHLGLPVKLAFAVITKAKTPIVQILPVPTDPARVSIVTESLRQVWSAITEGHFYPTPSAMNCGGCPFKSRCPAFASVRSYSLSNSPPPPPIKATFFTFISFTQEKLCLP